MSKKITINKLDDIKFLFKEDTLIIFVQTTLTHSLPFSGGSSHYQEGKIVLLAPEKPKVIKADESITNDNYKLSINDKILFDNTNSFILQIKDNDGKYFLINKKDILIVFNN